LIKKTIFLSVIATSLIFTASHATSSSSVDPKDLKTSSKYYGYEYPTYHQEGIHIHSGGQDLHLYPTVKENGVWHYSHYIPHGPVRTEAEALEHSKKMEQQ
jgi:hypothetical protein